MQFADLMMLRPWASSSGSRALAALILSCAAPMSWAQPAAAPAAASAPAGAVSVLGQATSQRLTVEELLRSDSEAALRKLRGSPTTTTPVQPANVGAAMSEAVAAVSSIPPGLVPAGAREPAGDGLVLEAIYGLRGPDGDTRVVQVSYRGRSHTLSPGQEIAGVARLVQIKAPCASFAALPEGGTQAKTARRSSKAQGAPKMREACIEESPEAANVTSAMPVNLLSARVLPSPVQPLPPHPLPQLLQPVFSARD